MGCLASGKTRISIDWFWMPSSRICNFPANWEFPHPGYLSQLVLEDRKELLMVEGYTDRFYQRLALPLHLRSYFDIAPVLIHGRKFQPQLTSFPMGRSHSVSISHQIHEETLSLKGGGMWRTTHKVGRRKWNGTSIWSIYRCLLYFRYVLEECGEGVRLRLDLVFKEGTAASGVKIVGTQKKNPKTILGMVLNTNGDIELDTEEEIKCWTPMHSFGID